jgi:hypothetical protein
VLQFSPDCQSLAVAGLPMSVAPPSHLVPAAAGSGTSSTNVLQAERKEKLQRKRSHKARKQDRRAGRRDNQQNQQEQIRVRQRKRRQQQRDRRDAAIEAVADAQIDGTSSTVSGSKVELSSSFELRSGLYTATVSLTAADPPGQFTATLWGNGGQIATVFNLTPGSKGANAFEAVVTLPADGIYMWDVTSADGKWTLGLEHA